MRADWPCKCPGELGNIPAPNLLHGARSLASASRFIAGHGYTKRPDTSLADWEASGLFGRDLAPSAPIELFQLCPRLPGVQAARSTSRHRRVSSSLSVLGTPFRPSFGRHHDPFRPICADLREGGTRIMTYTPVLGLAAASEFHWGDVRTG